MPSELPLIEFRGIIKLGYGFLLPCWPVPGPSSVPRVAFCSAGLIKRSNTAIIINSLTADFLMSTFLIITAVYCFYLGQTKGYLAHKNPLATLQISTILLTANKI